MDLKTVVVMFSLINFTTGFFVGRTLPDFSTVFRDKILGIGWAMFRHFLGPDLLKGCDSGCGFNRFCEHTNIFIHGPSRHRNKNLPVAKNESPRIFSVCPFMWSSFFLYL